jgi:transcription factor MBP1
MNTQIYSATYSNVPVFEFVTSEGPIMRRKLDSWINATHILKIAKFPKAKRTRILEKDVQTGIHEKVQGGYGKYQGTYVPLDLGADIAKNFGVFDELRPIFEFTYIEGQTDTPPPAPKHNHASALNIAKRQANTAVPARKTKSISSLPNEPPKKRGRPKRVTLAGATEPTLKHSDTTPIDHGPSIGTFNNSGSFSNPAQPPSLTRQDTEQDAIQVMTSNMNLKNDDLELVGSDDDAGQVNIKEELIDSQENDLMGSKELFGTPRESFEKIIHNHHNLNPLNSSNGHASQHDPYSLSQYHQPSLNLSNGEQVYVDYFSTLLTYFLDDNKIRSNIIPDSILNPPQPKSKININQSIDNDGNTIFHWACSMANVPMIEFLLNTFEISPDVRNTTGETALMFLVKFSNSYQIKNVPIILQLLLESILSVDNSGKTVLHHIAAVECDKKNKERFARYYMETLFEKLLEALGNDEDDAVETDRTDSDEIHPSRKELITKFTNHQDSDGNTAFHIAAYNLNKSCIKVFISYHKYIDFGLRNLVSYTVEDYLASHNFVLRLDQQDQDSSDQLERVESEGLSVLIPQDSMNTQSFESQLYNSKMAVNLQNTTSNLITEKLTELAYTIDKELSEKDENILSFFKILKVVNKEKLASQKTILSYFKLDYLMDDIDKSSQESNPQELEIDFNKDRIIQDEIHRLVNDLCFQHLLKQKQLEDLLSKYRSKNEKLQKKELEYFEQSELLSQKENRNGLSVDSVSKFDLAIELTNEITKRKSLMEQLYKKQLEISSVPQDEPSTGVEVASPPLSTSSTSTTMIKLGLSIISNYSSDDKLTKYCKLISLCCGMNFNDVENSIDMIEQSLLKSAK